jgi:hypothetical protein
MGGHDLFFLTLNTLFDVMRAYQNEHNMLPRCLSILLLQTSKTDNNARYL